MYYKLDSGAAGAYALVAIAIDFVEGSSLIMDQGVAICSIQF